jgi:ATP-dependent DNA helicase Q1
MSDLEAKLDELRRELSSSSSSSNGGISVFPHAVLTSEQISLLSRQKPTTEGEVRCFATYFPCVFAIAESMR